MMAIKEAIPVWQSMGVAAKTALAGIRTGVLATGIGALVIAVASLVAFWDDIKIAISGAGAEQEKLAKNAKKKVEADKTALTVYEKQWELLKAQGKTEKEIAKLQLGKLNTMIKNAEIQVATAKKTRDAEVQSSKWWAKFWQGMWDASAGFLKGLFGGLDAIGQVLGEDFGLTKWLDETGKGFVKFFADPEAVKAEQDKIVAESEVYLLDLKIKYKEAENTISEVTKKEGEKRVEITDKTQKDKLDLTRQNRDKEVALMQEGIEKERTIIKEKYKREKEDLEANSKDKIVDKEQYAAAEKLIQENLDKELLDLQKKYAELKLQQNITEEEKQLNATIATREKELSYMADSFEKEGELKQTNFEKQRLLAELNFDKAQNDLNAQFDAGTLAREEYDRLTLLNSQKYHEANKALDEQAKKEQEARDKAEFERRQAETTAKVQIVKDSLSLISEITTLFGSQNEKAAKRAFLVDKAAKLASASISGIEGTINAYKTAQSSPITALFPAYPAIQAGLAGAFAAVNIAKISQSKFGGSTPTQDTGGGGGAAAGGGGMTAQFNTIGTSGINQLATLQQQPVQAYVVSGEVTSAQSLDRNRVQNATL